MRAKRDFRTIRRENYNDFCKKFPNAIEFEEWQNVILDFSDAVSLHILETGEAFKLPNGFGDITITKKRRKKTIIRNGKEVINLPIDWKKTKEKGKYIYNFNYHTEGYFFGWNWNKRSSMMKFAKLWKFKPYRVLSRKLKDYIMIGDKYRDLYKETV